MAGPMSCERFSFAQENKTENRFSRVNKSVSRLGQIRLMLVTTKKAAGLRPVNSLQIAAGQRPVEKLTNFAGRAQL
jgi:hypothetical protein